MQNCTRTGWIDNSMINGLPTCHVIRSVKRRIKQKLYIFVSKKISGDNHIVWLLFRCRWCHYPCVFINPIWRWKSSSPMRTIVSNFVSPSLLLSTNWLLHLGGLFKQIMTCYSWMVYLSDIITGITVLFFLNHGFIGTTEHGSYIYNDNHSAISDTWKLIHNEKL